LEAPVERVVEQETSAEVNVKAVVPLFVARGDLGADVPPQLLARVDAVID
jgi:hypothetical protein